MRPFNEEQLRQALQENLDPYQPQSTFAGLWDKRNRSNRGLSLTKLKVIPQAALISLLVLLVVGFMLTPQADNIDYPFVDDPAVIGKWVTVDLVASPEKFEPGQKPFNKELYVTSLVFIKDGKMLAAINQGNGQLSPGPGRWTRGKVLDQELKTASQYIIKQIQGTNYMFFQWKNGDYRYLHRQPWYFVLKQVDDRDYSDYKPVQTVDKTDYPFSIDQQAIGIWKAVDFVNQPDQFDPGYTHLQEEPFIQTMEFRKDGTLMAKALTSTRDLKWTRNYIIYDKDQTASRYIIKEIDDKTYMFMEWKNGDYIYRGVKPSYYVLEKNRSE